MIPLVPVKKNKTIAGKLGLCLALFHLLAFVVLTLYVRHSPDPQAPLLLGVFAVIDFPVSLLYFFAAHLRSTPSTLEPLLAELLYLPNLIHGLVGTIWWYFLPRLLTPRRFGGIW